MIRYLVDTDVVSHATKKGSSGNVAAWLASVEDKDLAISVITLRGRLEGAERARKAGASRAMDIAADVQDMANAYQGRILPIDEDVARRWTSLLVPDKSCADDKCQVAIAAARGLTLVSRNARDVQGRGVPFLNPGRRPPKLYPA